MTGAACGRSSTLTCGRSTTVSRPIRATTITPRGRSNAAATPSRFSLRRTGTPHHQQPRRALRPMGEPLRWKSLFSRTGGWSTPVSGDPRSTAASCVAPPVWRVTLSGAGPPQAARSARPAARRAQWPAGRAASRTPACGRVPGASGRLGSPTFATSRPDAAPRTALPQPVTATDPVCASSQRPPPRSSSCCEPAVARSRRHRSRPGAGASWPVLSTVNFRETLRKFPFSKGGY